MCSCCFVYVHSNSLQTLWRSKSFYLFFCTEIGLILVCQGFDETLVLIMETSDVFHLTPSIVTVHSLQYQC